jgi:XRE family transcriptional regulator, regulator of sulfur utilization
MASTFNPYLYMDTKAILEKIRIARISKGIKQDMLAEKIGCSQNHYSEIERGKHKLDLEKLFKIATALEMDYRDFIPPR